MKVWDNIIIGAGVSGLVLARRIQESGADVLIIEKSKSVGGRMATRRDGDAAFDHGAQLTSLSLTNHLKDELWKPWVVIDGETKFALNLGMNKIGKNLAQGLDVKLNEKVINLKQHQYVTVEFESGHTEVAKRVFLTCPVPQSVELLKTAQINYPESLAQVQYAKALVGLFRLESNSSQIKNFTYEENAGRGIFSVSNQQSKGVSENLAFTVVMNPKFSEQYFEHSEADSLFLIENCFTSYLTTKFKLNESEFTFVRSQLKKWRYSHPIKSFGLDYLALADQKVVLIGDGFTGGSLAKSAASARAVPI